MVAFKNERAFDMIGCSVEEYMDWCKENGLKYHKSESKRKFFEDYRSGKIRIVDSKIVKGE